MSMIKGLALNPPERWKIKIGRKGAERKGKSGKMYRLPEKLDHFIITTTEKDAKGDYHIDSNLLKLLGRERNKDGNAVVIGPFMFMFNDIPLNFYTAHAYYTSQKCICRGNGETAIRHSYDKDGKPTGQENIPCDPETCPFAGGAKDNKLCKPNGILSMMPMNADVMGGVAKFRTTSWNSVIAIMTQLRMFWALTGGNLVGIPFCLRLNPKEAYPKGKKVMIYYVTLEFRGNVENLLEASTKVKRPRMLSEAKEAQQLMLESNNKTLNEDTEEWYPEAQYDDESGLIVDADGATIDEVDREEEEPEGEDNPFREDPEEKRSYIEKGFEPTMNDFIQIRKEMDMLQEAGEDVPESTPFADIMESHNADIKDLESCALDDLKMVVRDAQKEWDVLMEFKKKVKAIKSAPKNRKTNRSSGMFA